jgi:hypothetical protein
MYRQSIQVCSADLIMAARWWQIRRSSMRFDRKHGTG